MIGTAGHGIIGLLYGTIDGLAVEVPLVAERRAAREQCGVLSDHGHCGRRDGGQLQRITAAHTTGDTGHPHTDLFH